MGGGLNSSRLQSAVGDNPGEFVEGSVRVSPVSLGVRHTWRSALWFLVVCGICYRLNTRVDEDKDFRRAGARFKVSKDENIPN